MKTTLTFLLFIPFFCAGQLFKTDQYSEFTSSKPKYKKSIEKMYLQINDSLLQIRQDEYIWLENSYISIWWDPRDGNHKKKNEKTYSSKTKNKVVAREYYCDKLIDKTVKIYDKDSITIYDSKEKIIGKTIHQKSNNSWTEFTKLPAPWTNNSYYVTFWDSIKQTIYEYKDSILKSKIVYFKTGNREDSLFQYDSNNELYSKTVWKYNNHGDIEFMQGYDPKDKWPDRIKTYYQYKYDDNGNWIEKIEMRKNPSSTEGLDGVTKYIDDSKIIKREIIYN